MKKAFASFAFIALALGACVSASAEGLSRNPCELSPVYCREGLAFRQLTKLSDEMHDFDVEVKHRQWADAYARTAYIGRVAREYGVSLPEDYATKAALALAHYNRLENLRAQRLLSAVATKT